jgi:hypothetical protein
MRLPRFTAEHSFSKIRQQYGFSSGIEAEAGRILPQLDRGIALGDDPDLYYTITHCDGDTCITITKMRYNIAI